MANSQLVGSRCKKVKAIILIISSLEIRCHKRVGEGVSDFVTKG